jgi:tetratricopeptide (TPR) repeat protein
MPLDYAREMPPAAAVRQKALSRDELLFETDAPGAPHLIKVAYHPRWQLLTKGQMAVAGPGFMLVVPQERAIRLAYGRTLVGQLGIAATASAGLCLLLLAWGTYRRAGAPLQPGPVEQSSAAAARWRWRAVLLVWLAMAGAGWYLATRSPEQMYNRAWESMRANRYAQASADFLRAYELRRPPAKKEEALFWLAKSTELAGQKAQAKARYRELAERYHGYWLPESLYTYALLETLDGNREVAAPYAARLRAEYPGNKWTLKLDELK